MNRSNGTKYGWVLVLSALGALWLRIENQSLVSSAQAAPSAIAAEDAPLPPTTMAIVDVAVVFKGYRQFNEEMAKIKVEIADFDALVKSETQVLANLGERLKLEKPDSDARKQLQAEFTAKTTDLQIRIGVKKTDLLKSEAELYYDSYRKLEAAVTIVARKKKIGFVLRFNGDEMKRDDRNSVLQGVNRAVITYPTDNDITAAVLTELNRS